MRLKIAIIGPEASGKTELAKALNAAFQGQEFQSVMTEEFARDYFAREKLPADHALTLEQMREVMKGQRAVEDAAAEGITAERGVIWIDASAIHGPLYAGMKMKDGKLAFDLFGVDEEVMDYARKGAYDAFILCVPHESLGWQDDGMRAMPDLADRKRFSDACIAFVNRFYRHSPLVPIAGGTWGEREGQAIEIAKLMLNVDSK